MAAQITLCAVLELIVMGFQMMGVAGLCLSRLFPPERWAGRGRVVLIVALFGLGITGAWCGTHDSEFGLFAGGTMTVLLIAMTLGDCHPDTSRTAPRRLTARAPLAG